MQVDWFHLISDLERAGVTLRSQAEKVEVSAATLCYWKSGGEPKFRNGYRLIDLYANTLGKSPPLSSILGSTR